LPFDLYLGLALVLCKDLLEFLFDHPFDSSIKTKDHISIGKEGRAIVFMGVSQDLIGACLEIDPSSPILDLAEPDVAFEGLLDIGHIGLGGQRAF